MPDNFDELMRKAQLEISRGLSEGKTMEEIVKSSTFKDLESLKREGSRGTAGINIACDSSCLGTTDRLTRNKAEGLKSGGSLGE